jgi:predicted TIM-barrel fold metal-dependent hydrolase
MEITRLYATEAPERCLWASDWPHPTERDDNMPDDADLLDRFAEAVPDANVRERILVVNPAVLYGFD